MEVGEKLRQLRLLQGKSQKDMIDGYLDRSFYSRVENNKNSIAAEDLINILQNNNISIVDFFNSFGDANPKNQIYQKKIESAFMEKDIDELKSIKEDNNFTNKIIKDVAELMLAKFENNSNKYGELRQRFKKYIYHLDKWDEDSLWTLSYTMFIYDFNDLEGIVDSIFNKYQFHKVRDSKIIYLLAQIAINYLKICLEQDRVKAQIKRTLTFLEDLPNIDEIALYKMYGTCYQEKYNKRDYENILKECGYGRYFDF